MRKNPEIKKNVTLNNALAHLNKIDKRDQVLSGVYLTDKYLYKTDGLRLMRLPNPFGTGLETGVYDLNSLTKYDNADIRYPEVEKFIAEANRRVFCEFEFTLAKDELKDLKSHKYDKSIVIQTTDDNTIEISTKDNHVIATFPIDGQDVMFEKRTTLPKTLINLFEAMLDVPTKKFRAYYGQSLQPMLFTHEEFNYLITFTRSFE